MPLQEKPGEFAGFDIRKRKLSGKIAGFRRISGCLFSDKNIYKQICLKALKGICQKEGN